MKWYRIIEFTNSFTVMIRFRTQGVDFILGARGGRLLGAVRSLYLNENILEYWAYKLAGHVLIAIFLLVYTILTMVKVENEIVVHKTNGNPAWNRAWTHQLKR